MSGQIFLSKYFSRLNQIRINFILSLLYLALSGCIERDAGSLTISGYFSFRKRETQVDTIGYARFIKYLKMTKVISGFQKVHNKKPVDSSAFFSFQ